VGSGICDVCTGEGEGGANIVDGGAGIVDGGAGADADCAGKGDTGPENDGVDERVADLED
jgi:hypothetical protein